MLLTITDETLTGTPIRTLELDLPGNSVTVRELIASRVTAEVERYNKSTATVFQGLVQPTETERLLNRLGKQEARTIDAERQIYVALDAFQKNAFLLLVDDVQLDELTQRVELRAGSQVSFIPLTPLIGG
jgi:hypothetical protein